MRKLLLAFDVLSAIALIVGSLICMWTSIQQAGTREFWLWLAAAYALGSRSIAIIDEWLPE